jgi:hypothetical protein
MEWCAAGEGMPPDLAIAAGRAGVLPPRIGLTSMGRLDRHVPLATARTRLLSDAASVADA